MRRACRSQSLRTVIARAVARPQEARIRRTSMFHPRRSNGPTARHWWFATTCPRHEALRLRSAASADRRCRIVRGAAERSFSRLARSVMILEPSQRALEFSCSLGARLHRPADSGVVAPFGSDQARPRPSAISGCLKEAPRRGAGTLPDSRHKMNVLGGSAVAVRRKGPLASPDRTSQPVQWSPNRPLAQRPRSRQ
jgi:hypothetical protein